MAEWQPIGTAPKDGTPVLLFDSRRDVGVGIGIYVGESYEVWEKVDAETKKLLRVEQRGYWNAMTAESIGMCDSTITHWQPLPLGPAETPIDVG